MKCKGGRSGTTGRGREHGDVRCVTTVLSPLGAGGDIRCMLIFLCLVFVLSGAAGLMYEAIWTRYLGLFVGHSASAQVLVLVIFLVGLSAGAVAIRGPTQPIR